MFIAGAEWQLQQLSHPDPPGEQGADGTITIKKVMKEKAIEAFNEAMSYFESPDCPTAKEALKHFIACLDQEPDSGCLEKPNDWNSSNHEKYEINSKAVQEPAGQLCKLSLTASNSYFIYP